MLLKIIYTTGFRIAKVNLVKINDKKQTLEFVIITKELSKQTETINLNDKNIVVIHLDNDIIYPKNQKTNLVAFLKDKMVIHKLSQKELAEYLEISPPSLNYVMNGKRVAGDKIMRQIARKFGLTLSEVREMREMEKNIKEENK